MKTQISFSDWEISRSIYTNESVGLSQFIYDLAKGDAVEFMTASEALELAAFINKHFGG